MPNRPPAWPDLGLDLNVHDALSAIPGCARENMFHRSGNTGPAERMRHFTLVMN